MQYVFVPRIRIRDLAFNSAVRHDANRQHKLIFHNTAAVYVNTIFQTKAESRKLIPKRHFVLKNIIIKHGTLRRETNYPSSRCSSAETLTIITISVGVHTASIGGI